MAAKKTSKKKVDSAIDPKLDTALSMIEEICAAVKMPIVISNSGEVENPCAIAILGEKEFAALGVLTELEAFEIKEEKPAKNVTKTAKPAKAAKAVKAPAKKAAKKTPAKKK